MKIRDLIQEHNLNFSTYYSGELYTHTPMALIALKDLGASDERLAEFFDKDTKKLEPKKESTHIIDEGNWKEFLGDFELEAAYVTFFNKELNSYGIEEAITEYFDTLIKGVGAAAFHPMIRLFYGLSEDSEEEVAIALGTWAASFLDLGVDQSITEKKSLLEILSEYKDKSFNQGEKIKGDNIAKRMLNLSKEKDYLSSNSSIFRNEINKQNLEISLLWLYSQSNDFTLLHGITSHHAFESLLAYSKNQVDMRVYYWKAILAAYLSTTGFFEIDLGWKYPNDIVLPSWSEIKRLAIMSNDDHAIKLVHVLSIKENLAIDYELRFAAALKLGLVKS